MSYIGSIVSDKKPTVLSICLDADDIIATLSQLCGNALKEINLDHVFEWTNRYFLRHEGPDNNNLTYDLQCEIKMKTFDLSKSCRRLTIPEGISFLYFTKSEVDKSLIKLAIKKLGAPQAVNQNTKYEVELFIDSAEVKMTITYDDASDFQ